MTITSKMNMKQSLLFHINLVCTRMRSGNGEDDHVVRKGSLTRM